MPVARAGYSAAQIALHWTIAVLIIVQVVLHEGMEAAYRAVQGGPAATESELLLSDLHVACGIAVFLLALLRVVLAPQARRPTAARRGAPEALRLAARAVHFAFYAVILLMPATGALAWFGGVGAMAAVHGAGMLTILVLLLLHIAGALYHHFVLKTDVLRRMLRPEQRRLQKSLTSVQEHYMNKIASSAGTAGRGFRLSGPAMRLRTVRPVQKKRII